MADVTQAAAGVIVGTAIIWAAQRWWDVVSGGLPHPKDNPIPLPPLQESRVWDVPEPEPMPAPVIPPRPEDNPRLAEAMARIEQARARRGTDIAMKPSEYDYSMRNPADEVDRGFVDPNEWPVR